MGLTIFEAIDRAKPYQNRRISEALSRFDTKTGRLVSRFLVCCV